MAFCAVHTACAQELDTTAAVSTSTARNNPARDPAFGHWRLLTAGAIVATVAIAPFDTRAAAMFQRHWLQSDAELKRGADAAAFMGGPGPFLVGASLFAGGKVMQRPALADAGLHVTESVLLAASITALGKGISGRSLPNTAKGDADDFEWGRGFHKRNGAYVSFPSGHTAAAFALASSLTKELSLSHPKAARFFAPLAYGGASAIGLARMYQNVHWASDLPIAALIGSWSGVSVVHFHHAHGVNAFDKLSMRTQIAPSSKGLTVTVFTR
jgi:membrane-associated phospholipid phosphatase